MKSFILIGFVALLFAGCQKDKITPLTGSWKYIGYKNDSTFISDSKSSTWDFNANGSFRYTGAEPVYTGNYKLSGNRIVLNGDDINASAFILTNDTLYLSGRLMMHPIDVYTRN